MERYDAIYGRQSADRADSISIESQIEFCQYEIRGGEYKVFQDKGYSGKNTDRPQFQQMLNAIRCGEINRVVVYKLDRISRSILDFSTMMEEFQKYGVEFVSCTEKFDTSTPMGRAMLNICIVFAQLERETIQMRVSDAYASRSRKGFYMGGAVPYGYRVEPYLIDGKKTSRYVVDPSEAEVIKMIFSMYAEPQTSFGDIVKYLAAHNITNLHSKDGVWDRSHIPGILKNPVYVMADLDIYRFYKDQGAILHNSPEDYIGVNGCYLYEDKDAERKTVSLEGQHVVLAPHEGIIPSEVWLKVRMKCLGNKKIAKPLKAKNTWLAGKIKCAKCGYTLNFRWKKGRNKTYFVCSRKVRTGQCEGVGWLDAAAIEQAVFTQIAKHLEEFDTLTGQKGAIENPLTSELNIKIEQALVEIEKLLDKVPNATDVLMEYINKRVSELDSKVALFRNQLKEIAPIEQQAKTDVLQLKDCIYSWERLSFDDKRNVVDQLIGTIRVEADHCEIVWKI